MDIHNNCFAVPFLETFVNSTKMTMTYHCKIFELEKNTDTLYLTLQNPSERLGCHHDSGFNDIQSHPFFRAIQWDVLEQKLVTPPYKPSLKSDRDLEHFDPAFTDEPVQLTPDDPYVDSLLFVFYIVLVLSSSHFLIYRYLWCLRASILAKYFQKMTNRKKHWY